LQRLSSVPRKRANAKRVLPTTIVLALFFVLPVAALAQGSPFDTGFTAGVAAGTGIAVLAVNVLSWLWGV
jgi:hypothetical protein